MRPSCGTFRFFNRDHDEALMQPAARAVQLLAGTAPVRKSYLLLHHALPPSAYPAQLASFSSLLASVQLRCAAWDVEVNLAYLGPQRTAKPAPRYSPQREAEITLFSFERRVGYKLPALSCRELDRSPTHPMYDVLHTFVVKYDTDSYLLVCTHGRCADTGGAVAAALRRRAPPSVRVGEIAHAGGRECVTAPLIRSSRHAANVLVCPSGDWYA